ncbi:MAG: hypothetical protein KF817_03455 [Phycisphaeraceae bacterium]|nr:hypothetical protein [Phycisphaeraceae bacterium]
MSEIMRGERTAPDGTPAGADVVSRQQCLPRAQWRSSSQGSAGAFDATRTASTVARRCRSPSSSRLGDCPGAQVTQGSVAECIDRLGYTNPAALEVCIEAMIINGTP